MHLISKIKITKSNYLSLLLAFFPISFIAGNMIININLFVIILSSIVFFGRDLLKIKFNILDKLIFLFFLLIVITGPINDYHIFINKDFPSSVYTNHFTLNLKTFYFLKYLLFYIVVRYLIEKNILNFKYFFIFSLICILFVCTDLFYQFFIGKDIFGFEARGRKLGGPFGDELIAGGYLQRFSLFAIFLFPLFFQYTKIKNFQKYVISFLLIIILIGLILSGNRMPLLIFVFMISLMAIFQKQIRKFFLPFAISFILIFFLLFNISYKIKLNFWNFYSQIHQIVSVTITKDKSSKYVPQYFKEFSTFYDTWKMNKYIGGGIKNFRFYCHVRPNIEKNSNFICNMHPHNYYLEILTETGLVGFLIISLIFIILVYQSFYQRYFTKFYDDKLSIPFIYLFIAEIFPIKSTGSFFTTGNSTYLFLIIAILIGLSCKYSNINPKLKS